MKIKITVWLVALSVLFLLFPSEIQAAKPRISRGVKKATVASSGRSVPTSVKFRPDRRGILINFLDFSSAQSVTYILTYTGNGLPQGARGTATVATADQERELLFGTCSSGVCRYHANIQDAKLVIDSKLKSGLTVRKTYRLKV